MEFTAAVLVDCDRSTSGTVADRRSHFNLLEVYLTEPLT